MVDLWFETFVLFIAFFLLGIGIAWLVWGKKTA